VDALAKIAETQGIAVALVIGMSVAIVALYKSTVPRWLYDKLEDRADKRVEVDEKLVRGVELLLDRTDGKK
jgi:hypothetical protein